MNRYLLFGGESYYARGGFHDYRGSFETPELAHDQAVMSMMSHHIEWFHIVDISTGVIVMRSDNQAHGVDD